jgi:site-specific DNA-methyltransferase (adenine-specific)
MKLYSTNGEYSLYQGNMLDMLEVIEPNSIDSIITDPPYGLTSITKRFGKENSAECQYGKDGSFARLSKGFMGKEWDGSGIEYNIEAWKKCYEVLKPGGYLLAFGGSRTFHRIACAIEDAGFEIRDTIMWLYGSGFPKSHNIGLDIDKLNGCPDRGHRIATASRYHPDGTLEPNGEQLEPYQTKTEEAHKWNGWGTALKPSFEPIIVARKPLDGTVAKNCLKWGVGGINIDECRVGTEKVGGGTMPDLSYVGQEQKKNGNGHIMSFGQVSNAPRIECEEHIGRFPANTILTYDEEPDDERLRYFYCAKASKKDRDEGLDEFEEKKGIRSNAPRENEEIKTKPRKNTHPTVKPTELMQYLVRLVTPNGGTILDPFNGSGSTGKAVMYENKERNKNYKYIGIELTEEYLPIAKARIEYVCNLKKEKNPQLSLFDDVDQMEQQQLFE